VGRWLASTVIPYYLSSYLRTQMNVSCRAKLPDVFDVRVTGIGLRLLKETVIPYNHSTVENFNITVTVGVEVCTDLRMKIRGRDSAGRTSQYIDIPVGECQYCSKEVFELYDYYSSDFNLSSLHSPAIFCTNSELDGTLSHMT